jgi:hypothetical protein
MPGNGNGNEGEHGPEAVQPVDDALVALVATIGEGTCGIVDTVRDVTSRGVPGWSRLPAGIQFGGVRRRSDVEPATRRSVSIGPATLDRRRAPASNRAMPMKDPD